MTRIVAGTAGGRTIAVPPRGTRPTSERVREALFSRLEHMGVIDGATIVDLYAGSGALGFEAASRGASEVTLVEASGAAAAVCRRNVAALGLSQVHVVAEKTLTFLRRAPDSGTGAVDLALLDPPYDLPDAALDEVLTALVPHLALDAVVVVERSTRSVGPRWPAEFTALRERRYGETTLWFAEHT